MNINYVRKVYLNGAGILEEKNKVSVRIAGSEYVISGYESPEHIQKIALYVDRKIQEITRKNHLLSTSMAAVLSSINMANDILRLQEQQTKMQEELTALRKANKELKEESTRLKNENEKAKERESQLKIELTRRETELKEVRNTINTISRRDKSNN